MGKLWTGGRDGSSAEYRGSHGAGNKKSPDKPSSKEEQALFSLWLPESHSSILPVNAYGSLDSREQGCSEETEDKVYSLLRILPRPARHSRRVRQQVQDLPGHFSETLSTRK